MSEKGKSVKAETKQTNAKGDASKTSTSKEETATANAKARLKKQPVILQNLERKVMPPNQHRRLRLVTFLAFQLRNIGLDGTKFLVNLQKNNRLQNNLINISGVRR